MSARNGSFDWKEAVSLKEYFDNKFADSEKMALLRSDVVNEKLVSLTKVVEAKQLVTEANIKNLELSKANMEGKASQNSVWIAILIAIAGIILQIFHLMGFLGKS